MSDLISRADAIEAIQNAYCKPCKERGDDYHEIRCRACDFDDAIIQIDAVPSADAETVLCALADRTCPFQGNEFVWCLTCPHISEEDRELVKRTVSEQKTVEWIPCSERLPRTGDDILVTFSDGEVNIIISARPKAWVKYEEANNLIFPVAWMPLPTPYKGGDDE